MIKDGAPWFIDFQGGRKGPFFYDVASFLWQAKAKFPETLRNELLEEYIDALSKYKPVDRDYFFSQLRHFVLFRTLQVLGAYGFRGYFEKKPHFIQSVPYAIENLRQLLHNEYPEYSYLCSVLKDLTELKQFKDDLKKRQLTVKVMSFGCTGGQHRSVYSAQHMAEHINKKFGVKVELIHREQNIEQTFERTL